MAVTILVMAVVLIALVAFEAVVVAVGIAVSITKRLYRVYIGIIGYTLGAYWDNGK